MAQSNVIAMRDGAGKQILLWLCEPGKVVLGHSIHANHFNPLFVRSWNVSAGRHRVYFVPKRVGPLIFCRDTMGQWTAFRDTFQLRDDGSFNPWYRCVHQALLMYVRGESEQFELFCELFRLGNLVDLTTVMETHNLR